MNRGSRARNYEGVLATMDEGVLATTKVKAGKKYGGMGNNRHGC